MGGGRGEASAANVNGLGLEPVTAASRTKGRSVSSADSGAHCLQLHSGAYKFLIFLVTNSYISHTFCHGVMGRRRAAVMLRVLAIGCLEQSVMLDHLFAEYWTICTLLDVTMPFQWHWPFCIQDSPLLHIPSNIATDMTGRPMPDVTGRYI
ncbi:hypothetical protein CHARACLAT_032434 [Characodon lateralis]|uniref:Uncharacterized protein n=1 Tax=Characodon lateralis TaxID=208331 RepID=A0ABU7DW17_9TELE|nr:hypothetical protein [Characodon lateralis]